MDLSFAPIVLIGFVISAGLTPVARRLAHRFGVVDKPNQRKIHQERTPLMGGLAIYVAFALALLLFSPPRHVVELGAILSGAAFLAVVGLFDDRFHLGIRIRLLAMAIAALVLVAAGIQIRFFRNPILDIPITVLWVVTLTNALNFMDNMDGLTAGVTAVSSATFMVLAWSQGLSLVTVTSAALMGSAIGFLMYNFHPASIFMGDMGALVLGFILSVLGIKLTFQVQPPNVTWMIPILVLALPIFDIFLVVITRLSEGRSPGEAGKDHTAHRLMSLGLSQRRAALVMYITCAFFGALACLVAYLPEGQATLVGLFGLGLLGVLFVFMMRVRQRYQINQKKVGT